MFVIVNKIHLLIELMRSKSDKQVVKDVISSLKKDLDDIYKKWESESE
jgi:hypothetical protein